MEKRSWFKQGTDLRQEIDATIVPLGQVALWHIGQCGFILKSSHAVVAIDLVLTDLLDKEGKPRTLFPPPFRPLDCPRIDYICCTHSHADHLDIQTIAGVLQANPHAKCIVSAAHRNLVETLNPLQLLFVRQDEKRVLAPNLSLGVVAVAHEEYCFDERGNSQFLGFVFDFGPIRVFHSGDALYEPILANRIQNELPIDIIMLPINGRDEQRHKKGIIGNMDSREAILFSEKIGASLFIPMHFDMFAANGADLEEFAHILTEINPSRPYHIPQLGKIFTYTQGVTNVWKEE